MDTLSVMPYEASMLEECIDLYQKVFSQAPWFEKSERSDVERFFRNFMASNKFLGYVVKIHDRIIAVSIGFLKPWIKGEEYYIDQFYVDFDLQGRGIGSFFLGKIKELLIAMNVHAMILATEKAFPSYTFYKKNGFSEMYGLCFLGTGF